MELSSTQTAFVEKAVSNWGDTVYRIALSHTSSPDDADDIRQDVFERLLKTTQSFASSEHLKAWLIRVTVNRCHDLAKSHHRSRTDSLESHPLEVARKLGAFDADEDEPGDRFASLASALSKLPEDQRETLNYFYNDGLTTDEIADITGTTPGAVRTRLYRARKALRSALAASLAILLTVGLGLVSPTGSSSGPTPHTRTAPAALPNFFILRAWGLPATNERPTTVTPVNALGVDWLHPQYWDPNFNPDNPFEEGPATLTGTTCTTFSFDALCFGSNLASVRFETTCTNAFFSYCGASAALAHYQAPRSSVTIDYHNEDQVRASLDIVLNVVLPLEGETLALYNDAVAREDYASYWGNVVPSGFVDAARALAGYELVLTASFDNGQTQTKRYLIEMAPNCDKRSAELTEAIIAQWEQNDGQVSDHKALPSFLILTEITS